MSTIADLATERIDDIMTEFGVEFSWWGDRIVCPCPVHGGDNPNGFTFYTNENNPQWCCFTHFCHNSKELKGILGFVLAMLRRDNPNVKFKDAVRWVEKFLKANPTTEVKRKKHTNFIQQAKVFKSSDKNQFPALTRNQFRSRIQIPADYYIKRGFSPEILDRYDVGVCTDQSKAMCNRVVVPVYDEKYEYTIGCTARSIFERCDKCKQYHSLKGRCPKLSPKWKHDYRFNKSQHLYNWWFCYPVSKETRKIFVVEGPGDVWRLAEAGIHNSVAIMGVNLSDSQQVLFERSGATDIMLCMDNDEAGVLGRLNITKKLENFFRINHVYLDQKDIGEMKVDEVKLLLKDYI